LIAVHRARFHEKYSCTASVEKMAMMARATMLMPRTARDCHGSMSGRAMTSGQAESSE